MPEVSAPHSPAASSPSRAPSPAPGPRTRRFVAWTLRYGALLWALALLAAIPATWRTTTLYRHLRSDVEELLPRDAPSVVAIEELRHRMAGLQYLGVILDVGAPENLAAGERFLEDLAARVRKYPKSEVSDVRTGYAAERAFVQKHAGSLMALDDLKTIRERVEARLHWEYAKKTDTLLDADEPAPPLDFSDIEHKYAGELGGGDLEGTRFSNRQLGSTLMLIEVGGFSTSAAQSAALIHRVEDDMRALGGTAAYAPGMRIGLTGDVAISAEEMAALVQDLTLSSALVVVAVLLAIVLFYGWTRSIPALFLPLALAAVYAFGLASLPPFRITELNSNTAFLGSIIIGNGINFGIIQLARYLEARRQGKTVEEALVVALWGTRWGTLSAALAAGVAYASLTAMQFRGFRQFGMIGGLGMAFAWGATVAAHAAAARLARPRRATRRASGRTPGASSGGIARAVGARPWLYAGLAALLTLRRGLGGAPLRPRPARVRLLAPAAARHLEVGRGLLGQEDGHPPRPLPDPDGDPDRQRGRGARRDGAPARAGLAPAARRRWSPRSGPGTTWCRPTRRPSRRELAVVRRKMTPNVRAQHRGRGSRRSSIACSARRTRPPPRRRSARGGPRRHHPRPARARRHRGARRAGLPQPRRELVARRDHRHLRARAARRRPGAHRAGRAARRASRAAPRCRSTSSRRCSATDRWPRCWRSSAWSLTVLLIFRQRIATPFVIGSLVVGVALAAGRRR